MEHCISVAVGFLEGGGQTPSPTPTPPNFEYGWYYIDDFFGPIINPIVYLSDYDGLSIEIGVIENEDGENLAVYDVANGIVVDSNRDAAQWGPYKDAIIESVQTSLSDTWGFTGYDNGSTPYEGGEVIQLP